MSETAVSKYERIFSKYLPNKLSDGTVPVASSLQHLYQSNFESIQPRQICWLHLRLVGKALKRKTGEFKLKA